MIFRRQQRDDIEGFRRMREALRQHSDPQEHALLDEQYGGYADDSRLEDELPAGEEELVEVSELEEYEVYEAGPAGEVVGEEPATSAVVPAPPVLPATTYSPTPPAVPTSGPSMTTIGADTSWSGTLRSESNVYLEGKIEGTIEARDTIYIAERATIDARLKAHSVVISGQLNGHIDCDGRLEVTPTGRFNGEAEVGSLAVHEGALLDGKIHMKSGMGSAGK